MEDKIINIYVDADNQETVKNARGGLASLIENQMGNALQFNMNSISESVEETYRNIVSIIDKLDENQDSKVKIESVEFSLVFDSQGKVSILSSVSSQVNMKAGIQFKLKINE